MSSKERIDALKILTDLLLNKTTLTRSMASIPELSPMTKELCFGFCRHYFRLQAIARCLITKKPKETEIWIIVLIGLYQLYFMNIPDYAVVKETVDLAEFIKKGWAKGLINAVLRNFCRKRETILKSLGNNEDFLYGQSSFLLKRFKNDWPHDWEYMIQQQDAHPPMTLRINEQKISVLNYLEELKKAGLEGQLHPDARQAVILKTPCEAQALPGFMQGWVSVQDAAAQLAASLLSLKPGLRILDSCAAPGGKTGHILESEPHIKECVALEFDSKRLNKVLENLNRLELKATLVQGDALNPAQWWDNQLFDRILLDAPCSATGVIRRHADIKLLRTEEEIHIISKTQYKMLKSLWPLLAAGGIMVYGTCSILAEENELQIKKFLTSQKDCQVLKINQSWGRPTPHGRQILPGDHGMDGFFYSVLMKKTDF